MQGIPEYVNDPLALDRIVSVLDPERSAAAKMDGQVRPSRSSAA